MYIEGDKLKILILQELVKWIYPHINSPNNNKGLNK